MFKVIAQLTTKRLILLIVRFKGIPKDKCYDAYDLLLFGEFQNNCQVEPLWQTLFIFPDANGNEYTEGDYEDKTEFKTS